MIPQATPVGTDVTKEYRAAVVMYGGISLAIYMNGVAQELLAMVRATAAQDRAAPGSPMISDLKGTEAVYRDLALLVSEENDGDVHVRFIIDIISGTSAGGINGVFLAKALTQRKDLTSLKRTWVEEGDFQKLLNDHASNDVSLPRQIPPRSLLSGERMYVKLLEAFAEMDDDVLAADKKSYVEDLELSVTTTDLLGTVLPLRLADRLIWERKYKRVFVLRYREDVPAVDDFQKENTPFLAFAARCTSSFPAAFEPMQLASVPRLIKASQELSRNPFWSDTQVKSLMESKWLSYFGPGDPLVSNADRFFADGGYLDNHPFDHAIESLRRVSSSVRSERKLLYIEPSPEHPELDRTGESKNGKPLRPDALENLWAGVAGIPDKQPIRDSIMEIQRRNLLIRKVNLVIGEISAAVERSDLTDAQLNMATLDEPHHQAAAQKFRETLELPKYAAYRALKLYAVTDTLATRVAALLHFDEESDYVLAIRYLVKQWRIAQYDNKNKQADFLLTFDIEYRLRRYQFVKSQLQLLSCLDEDARTRLRPFTANSPTGSEIPQFRGEILTLMAVLDDSFRRVKKASLLAEKSEVLTKTIEKLNMTERDLNQILGLGPNVSGSLLAPLPVIHEGGEDGRAKELLNGNNRSATLMELQNNIADHYQAEMAAARRSFTDAIKPSPADPPMRCLVLRLASVYFNGFQDFDAAIFPITYGTDAGELVPVDVLRVSPEDAIAIQDESKTKRLKLAGSSFGAFGAFLEKAWRTNDILWGRLDGAERIVRSFAGQGAEADALITRAHNAIIQEELTDANRVDLSAMLVEALLREGADGPLAQARGNTLREQIETCVRSAAGSTDVNPKLKALLQNLLTTDQLRAALRNFEISREPNRKNSLESAARSARILGNILDDVGRRRPFLKKPGALLVQSASIMWGLVVVATPGSIWGSLASYWFGLLTLFSIVMIVGGTVFSQPMQSLGFRILVLVLAARLSVSVLRSLIVGDRRWQRLLEAGFVVALLVLLALGFLELQHIWAKFAMPLMASVRNWAGHRF